MSVLSIHFSSFQLSKNIIQWAEYIIVTSTLQYSHGLRNERHFCAEVSSQARSMLRFFAVKGSQIPLHSVNGRAAKNSSQIAAQIQLVAQPVGYSDASLAWNNYPNMEAHFCSHPSCLELPKTIHHQRLQRRFLNQSMGVLLKIRGNCSCLRAKVAHLVGHLPAYSRCVETGKCPEGSTESPPMIEFGLQGSIKAEPLWLVPLSERNMPGNEWKSVWHLF